MDLKPIPAFYGCYLLRSTIRHASLYIGSTPNPQRRLAQHNGQVKGGALRTSRLSLRPWEMTCVVAGFPSNIAALQFEWAWHNAHLTRHIAEHERLSIAATRTRISTKTGKTRTRPGQPRSSLTDKLSNLHLLLRASYFSRWPLEVRFFADDVYRMWRAWCDRVDGQIPSHIKVQLDLKQDEDEMVVKSISRPPKGRKRDLIGKGGVDGLDPTYRPLGEVLEKGQFVLDPEEPPTCEICRQSLSLDRDLITICPQHTCRSTTHLDCLSKTFLPQQSDAILPIQGECPSCHSKLDWSALMKEMTLRTRGKNEIQKVLKAKTKPLVGSDPAALSSEYAADEEEDDDEDDDDANVENDEGGLTSKDIADDVDDAESVTSIDSEASDKFSSIPPRSAQAMLPIVIEDSEDEIEIVTV